MNPIGEIWTHPSRGDNGMQRIRLLLLLPRLGEGGSQHVIALLANGLPREKIEVHLGLVAAAEMEPHSLLPQVKIHTLGAKRVRAGGLPLLHLIWQLKPDVILSGTAEVNFLTLLLRPFLPLRTRVLVRQNGTVSWALAHAAVPGYTHWLYRLLCFVGQVERVYAFFPGTTLFVLPSRFEGMPNSLLEAVAAGLPIVTTPASEGIVDLLRGEPGAWLTPEISVEALAATLIAALEATHPAERFARRFFPPLPAPADQTIEQLQNVFGR